MSGCLSLATASALQGSHVTAGASLEAAIYDYNHANWYVTEVLDLANEYAQEYQ